MTNQLSTQTKVSTFNFDNHAIRTITINNEPWFLSIDICNALNIANSRDAINKLDEDEYQTLSLKDTVGLTDSIANQVQSVGVVSESGMYTLILRCRDAVKKGSVPHRFRKWVTAEVLPAIRKTGKYEHQKIEPEKTHSFDFTEYELENLLWLWFGHKQMNELLGKLEQPLEAIGSRLHPIVYSHYHEYGRQHKELLNTMRKLLEPFKQSNRITWQRMVQHLS
nr:P22AR C-terminal domain-containing protein [uncultured Haemophilus sp.]